MCTYLFLREVLGPGTVSLAANRDERWDRPFDPPTTHDVLGAPAVFARDHLGGTWLGTNGRLLVALTNAPGSARDGALRSRGLLVRDLLGQPDVEGARSRLRRSVEEHAHAGFNLLLADARDALCATFAAPSLTEVTLPPGVHALENRRHGASRLLGPLPALAAAGPPRDVLARLAADVLSAHEPVPPTGHAPCRHGDVHGTVASTLVHLDGERRERSFLLFAMGPPCRTPFAEIPLP